MNSTITQPPPRHLPQELISLIISKAHNLHDLSLFALVSRAFYSEAVSFLYTHVEFASAAERPRPRWIRKISLWARSVASNAHLAHRVETLSLHLPECDLPVLYRRTLAALQACINLRELELYLSYHQTVSSWLIPAVTSFALIKLTTNIQVSDSLVRLLESQPSIRTLQLETFDRNLWLAPGSLPNLTHYSGFTRLISAARTSGAIWENLVHAELHDAYRWEVELLAPMPRLRVLDIVVAAGDTDLLAKIAERCQELRSLTLRDGNGIMHDRDGQLAGVSVTCTCTSHFRVLRSEQDCLAARFCGLVQLIEASFVPNHRSCIPSSTTCTSTYRPSATSGLALLLPYLARVYVSHWTRMVISTHRAAVRL